MRIEITGVLDAEARKVQFTCVAGGAWGFWKGEEGPGVGTYDVEFEIDEEVPSWSHSPSSQGDFSAGQPGETDWISVSGVVERVDDDSVVTLRIRTDLVMIEMVDASGVLAQGDSITFSVKSLDLYPYQL